MNYLKQFEGWVTSLKHNVFERARILLTLYYILIIGVLMSVFSLLLYYSLARNIWHTVQNEFPTQSMQRHSYDETSDNIEQTIFTGDLISLIFIALISYLLAGITLRPIRKALDNQRQFSADASHELRTPLAVIQSESEVVLRDKKASSTDLMHVINSNLEEVARMKKIVEGLLLIARSENDENTKNFSSINVTDILRKQAENFQIIAKEKKVELVKNLEGNIFIHGNEYLLSHVFLNLIQNSLEYTPPGGSIKIELTRTEKAIHITIQDTGIGISKNDLSHIFQRFYRGENARVYRKDGAGLGLAIVSEIIKDHGGQIKIESDVGKGTAVHVTFPWKGND